MKDFALPCHNKLKFVGQLRRGSIRLVRFVSAGDAPRLYHQTNFRDLALAALFYELQRYCLRGARFVPNISWPRRFHQHKSRDLRRVRRLKHLRIVMGGYLFWSHRRLGVGYRVSGAGFFTDTRHLIPGTRYLSFGITSLSPRKISRTRRSSGIESISKP